MKQTTTHLRFAMLKGENHIWTVPRRRLINCICKQYSCDAPETSLCALQLMCNFSILADPFLLRSTLR